MILRPNAPRFHALLERTQGKSIFIISRRTWDAMRFQGGLPFLLTTEDLAQTPLARAPSFLVAKASEVDTKIELGIYRLDTDDYPNPINVDRYTVWEELPPGIDIPKLVNAATTNIDDNFRHYPGDHVFLVKEGVGPGHHLPALPEQVVVLLRSISVDAV